MRHGLASVSHSLLPTRYDAPPGDDDDLEAGEAGEGAETGMTLPVEICLTSIEYDHTAKTVLSKCFDFPSLKIPTPFIFNPRSFACDEDCDTSCNTCLQRMSSCDSSCEFVASCASSGRRLEDSSDAITAEPKAVGWSERLAAAAAQEVK